MNYRKPPLPSDAALVKVPSVFEQIVAGTAEASFVYRDDKVAVFMDIQPLNPGHVLVIPLEPARFLCELNDDIAAHMFVIGKRVAEAIRCTTLECEGCIFFLQMAQRPDKKFLTCTFMLFPGTERMDLG
jgi:histidine triad (HIT) family protein